MTPHRGLPPPAAMIPLPTQQSQNILENMPHQWQNSEDMARNWMQLRIEEDRLKAEVERTKQEQSRVDIRKLELDLLREAHRIGIPPQVIPIMFAGGGALKGFGGEWLNDYYAQHMGHLQQQQMAQQQQQQQAQQQQQQQQQQQVHQMPQIRHSPGPDRKIRRETRVIGESFGPPGPPVHMGPPPGAAGMPPQQGPPPAGYMPPYPLPGMPAGPRGGPPAQQPPRPPQINTKDIHPHQPQQPSLLPGQVINTPHSQMQQVPQPLPPQSAQPAEAAIFFHHYVPPNSQSTSMTTPVKTTASPQTQLQSPFTHNPPSNQLTGPDYVSSPKKRKHVNASSSQQQQTPSTPFSPPFNATPLSTATTPSRTRRGHSRQRSETTGSSGRGYEPYSRARPRRSTGSPLPETNMSGPQLPSVTSTGDGVSGNGGGNGGPHHPHEQGHLRQEQQRQEDQRQDQQRQDQQRQDQQRHEQQRQDQQRPQSVPPSQQIGRPYSAGPDFRREPYPPPPHPPPPSSDGGRDSKSGNGRN